MDPRTSSCPMASSSCSSLPTVPSCNRPSIYGCSSNEPLVNRYFETIEHLDKVAGERCVALTQQQDLIRDSTLFHWWPRLKDHKATPK